MKRSFIVFLLVMAQACQMSLIKEAKPEPAPEVSPFVFAPFSGGDIKDNGEDNKEEGRNESIKPQNPKIIGPADVAKVGLPVAGFLSLTLFLWFKGKDAWQGLTTWWKGKVTTTTTTTTAPKTTTPTITPTTESLKTAIERGNNDSDTINAFFQTQKEKMKKELLDFKSSSRGEIQRYDLYPMLLLAAKKGDVDYLAALLQFALDENFGFTLFNLGFRDDGVRGFELYKKYNPFYVFIENNCGSMTQEIRNLFVQVSAKNSLRFLDAELGNFNNPTGKFVFQELMEQKCAPGEKNKWDFISPGGPRVSKMEAGDYIKGMHTYTR